MVPNLQHRALQHIARENRPPTWINAAERQELVTLRLAKSIRGDRWQLTELGWRGAGDVRVLHALGSDGPDAA